VNGANQGQSHKYTYSINDRTILFPPASGWRIVFYIIRRIVLSHLILLFIFGAVKPPARGDAPEISVFSVYFVEISRLQENLGRAVESGMQSYTMADLSTLRDRQLDLTTPGQLQMSCDIC
jgi:hypothetical protein